MIVGGDAGVAELVGFLGAEFAEGDADFHAERGDVADDIEHLLKLRGAAAHALPGGAHAEAGGTGVLGGAGVLS